jgi:hypothetical protein
MRSWNEFLEGSVLSVLPYDDTEIADLTHYIRHLAQLINDDRQQLSLLSEAAEAGRIAPEELAERRAKVQEGLRIREHDAALLGGKNEGDLTEQELSRMRKQLWRLRFIDEFVRVGRANDFEAVIRQGYSPEFMFDEWSSGPDGVKLGRINWELTLGQFRETRAEGNAFPLRTPDFDVTPDGIKLIRHFTPPEYAQSYEKYRIAELQRLIDAMGSDLWHPVLPVGKVECVGCGAIFDRADPRKLYCGERCRARARQRRWRTKDPERARLAQARYWKSYAEDEPS